MTKSKSIAPMIAGAIVLAALAAPMLAAEPTTIDFSNETVGAEPKSLVPVVGFWRIENDTGKKVLAVDGRQWKEGNPRRASRTRHARFMANDTRSSSIGSKFMPIFPTW